MRKLGANWHERTPEGWLPARWRDYRGWVCERDWREPFETRTGRRVGFMVYDPVDVRKEPDCFIIMGCEDHPEWEAQEGDILSVRVEEVTLVPPPTDTDAA